jgi:hypothetical protein
LPDISRASIEFIDNEYLLDYLQRREELEEAHSEYEDIDRQIKHFAHDRERLVCGNYMITGKWVDKKAFEVKQTKYFQTSIVNIDKQKIKV